MLNDGQFLRAIGEDPAGRSLFFSRPFVNDAADLRGGILWAAVYALCLQQVEFIERGERRADV